MEFIKAFCIAFSIYSKIPVPQFKWEEKDMRYHLIFFPFVGVLIGGLLDIWNYICCSFDIGMITYTCIGASIPLIITGGFHVDGFMDTMDAKKSYKSREEKLEIMKDPHVGAFSVIMLVVWGLVFLGAFSYFGNDSFFMYEIYGVFVCIFAFSRVISGILVLSLKNAKDDGMLHSFSDSASSKKCFVKAILYVELIICLGFMAVSNLYLCMAVVVATGLYVLFFILSIGKEFGGITGDLAGYFVVCLEIILTVVIAGYGFFISTVQVGIG